MEPNHYSILFYPFFNVLIEIIHDFFRFLVFLSLRLKLALSISDEKKEFFRIQTAGIIGHLNFNANFALQMEISLVH